MNISRCRSAGNDYWDAQLILNAGLFFEADRLDAAACIIIANGFDDPGVWRRFTQLKRSAEAQREVACLDWLRIRHARALSAAHKKARHARRAF